MLILLKRQHNLLILQQTQKSSLILQQILHSSLILLQTQQNMLILLKRQHNLQTQKSSLILQQILHSSLILLQTQHSSPFLQVLKILLTINSKLFSYKFHYLSESVPRTQRRHNVRLEGRVLGEGLRLLLADLIETRHESVYLWAHVRHHCISLHQFQVCLFNGLLTVSGSVLLHPETKHMAF